jgi:dihydrofolate reductase
MKEKTILSAIVAMTYNRVIGLDNGMPWSMHSDLKNFKRITSGNTVIMGRNTYESIGKALPNRRNIVITRQHITYSDAETYHSVEDAIAAVQNEKEVFIIGGGKIYAEVIDKIDKLYLSLINTKLEGDTYFPEFNKSVTLTVEHYEQFDKTDKDDYDFSFYEYSIRR